MYVFFGFPEHECFGDFVGEVFDGGVFAEDAFAAAGVAEGVHGSAPEVVDSGSVAAVFVEV